MKKNIIRALKLLALLIPVLLILQVDTTYEPGERNKLREFYWEEENSLDVVLLGASELYSGFSSALAYEEFGFTSYPYCIGGNKIELYASQLEEICNTQDPDIIVVEMTPALLSEPTNNDATLRKYIGQAPLSFNTIRTVWELGDRNHFLSYFFPFIMKHGTTDWEMLKSLADEDLYFRKWGYSRLKNLITYTAVVEQNDVIPVTGAESGGQPLSRYSVDNLNALLETCRERGYDNLLFVTFPHRLVEGLSYDRYLQTFELAERIESYGFPYLNLELCSDAIGLDYTRDFYNLDHMNLYGQEKMTHYLGGLLVEEFGVQRGSLSPESKHQWDVAVDYAHRLRAYFDDYIEKNPDTPTYLQEAHYIMYELDQMGPVEDLRKEDLK